MPHSKLSGPCSTRQARGVSRDCPLILKLQKARGKETVSIVEYDKALWGSVQASMPKVFDLGNPRS